jgi:peptide chain release factor subunit 1
MEEEQAYKLRKFIKELEGIRGRHTELVSVYIASGANLVDTINMLREEYSLAQNVKDKTVRKNVMAALDKVIQHLKLFKQTPENGLIVFCGNISQQPGSADLKLWSLEPPEKISVKIYRCDQTFILDPLKEMVTEKEVYGLIVMDAKEADIGILKGKRIENLKHMDSTVPAKTVKGGMSQGRYDRLREDAMTEFFNKVGEMSGKVLLPQPNLKGVIVGGPGPNKERFVREGYLHYEIQKKVMGIKDTGYTGDVGLEELVKRSQDLLLNASVVKEREIMSRFFGEMQKSGKVVYGFNEVMKALDMGAVDTLLISEGFDWLHVRLKCDSCGFEIEKDLPKDRINSQECGSCGKLMEVVESKDLVDILVEHAKNLGTKVQFISLDTGEGAQFKEIGGIGAFLRYKLA